MSQTNYAGQLNEIIGLEDFKLISLTGGGGKTSTLYALGKYFAARERVTLTTTTKIYIPSAEDCGNVFIGQPAECAAKIMELPEHSLSVAAREKLPEGKLAGFRCEDVDALLESGAADRLAVEADGARGLAFKCYEGWEPPIPQSTDCQLVMFGADALLRPVSSETIFRADLLRERYGVQKGETLSAVNAIAAFDSKSEYLKNSPDGARRVLCVNKAELLSPDQMDELMEVLRAKLKKYDMAILCSVAEDTVFDAIKFNGA